MEESDIVEALEAGARVYLLTWLIGWTLGALALWYFIS